MALTLRAPHTGKLGELEAALPPHWRRGVRGAVGKVESLSCPCNTLSPPPAKDARTESQSSSHSLTATLNQDQV